MHELTSHKVNGLNEQLLIEAVDERGVGGANHVYEITYAGPLVVPIDSVDGVAVSSPVCHTIQFQNGGIAEVGVNGISNEALLAIVEDRLVGFQSGQFSCRENAVALTKIQEAMMWLQKRTVDRVKRGVEGQIVA